MKEETTIPLQELFDDALKRCKYHIHKPKKRTKWKNKSGFYKVQKVKCSGCKQGYTWVYRVTTKDKEHRIARTNILRLKKDIQDMGLDWFVVDEKRALKTAKETHYKLDTLR